MKINKAFLAILIVLAVTLQFVNASTLEETFKKRIDASGIENLDLQNVNGSIDITSWKNSEIEIIAYKKVRASNSERAKRLMEILTIDINQDGSTLSVETRLPKHKRGQSDGFFSWLFNGGNSGTSVSYEIKVPKEMDLNARSTNGAVTVEDCKGKIKLNTTNGKIRAQEIAGAVRAHSTNGSINVSMHKFSEDEMSFKTTNGSIKLYLPYNTDADIEARTTNGSIRCELPMSERYTKSKRRLEGEINDGGSLIYMKTTNGSISVLEY